MFKKILLASLLVAFSAFTVSADFPINYEVSTSVVQYQAFGDVGVAVIISYDGSADSATIDLNGNALEFHAGTVGSEDNAYSGEDVNGANTCGTTNGALDLTAGNCVTYAGLVDEINDAHTDGLSDFHAVLIGAIGTETTTVAEFEDPADAQVKIPGGYALLMDISDVDNMVLTLVPWARTAEFGKLDIDPWLMRGTVRNPAPARQVARLSSVTAMQDGTGAGTLVIYFCVFADANDGSPTCTMAYTAAAADTTVYNLDLSQNPYAGLGGYWLIQLNYGADGTAGYLMANGDFGRYK